MPALPSPFPREASQKRSRPQSPPPRAPTCLLSASFDKRVRSIPSSKSNHCLQVPRLVRLIPSTLLTVACAAGRELEGPQATAAYEPRLLASAPAQMDAREREYAAQAAMEREYEREIAMEEERARERAFAIDEEREIAMLGTQMQTGRHEEDGFAQHSRPRNDRVQSSPTRVAPSMEEKVRIVMEACLGISEETAAQLLVHTDGSVREALMIARDALNSGDTSYSELSQQLDGPENQALSPYSRRSPPGQEDFAAPARRHHQHASPEPKMVWEKEEGASQAGGTQVKTLVSLVLDMQLDDITDTAEFTHSVQTDIARACGVRRAAVSIQDIRAGSVIVDVVLSNVSPAVIKGLQVTICCCARARAVFLRL